MKVLSAALGILALSAADVLAFSITSPVNGARVRTTQVATVTGTGATLGSTICLIVQDNTFGGLFGQGAATHLGGGQFTGTVFLGKFGSPYNLSFTIFAVENPGVPCSNGVIGALPNGNYATPHVVTKIQ